MGYDDPRLAAIHDIDNPDGPDHDFFRRVADEHQAADIIDLGCGTGILTVTLAGPGRTVTGIDPSRAMLDHARNRPRGDKITWILGTGEQIAPASADMVVMSGNVAMHILRDQWPTTLERIAHGLRPGGILVFKSRNPEARAWEQWNEGLTERGTTVGRLRESLVTVPPDEDGVVVMHCHNEFVDDQTVLDVDQELQFRTHGQIVEDLTAAGLVVDATYRDWHQHPFHGGHGEPLMVFLATRH
ncbi:class I SAM-dependent methyltransferase [Luteococcus sp. H138]|uniref:class I SAM-dependent methyltransferase n=1 Tax=unclassified Luteococcus TaxID=2639923 RepID=UPI00313C7788